MKTEETQEVVCAEVAHTVEALQKKESRLWDELKRAKAKLEPIENAWLETRKALDRATMRQSILKEMDGK